MVIRMTTYDGSPLSLVPFPNGLLKNLKDIDKWSSLSSVFQLRECQWRVWAVLVELESNQSNLLLCRHNIFPTMGNSVC